MSKEMTRPKKDPVRQVQNDRSGQVEKESQKVAGASEKYKQVP